MGAVVDFAATRPIASFRGEAMRTASEGALPPGCKGAACPAFALCQGRCGPAQREGRAIAGSGERQGPG